MHYIVTNVTTGSTIRAVNSPIIQLFNLKNNQGCSRATLVSMNVLKNDFPELYTEIEGIIKEKIIPY